MAATVMAGSEKLIPGREGHARTSKAVDIPRSLPPARPVVPIEARREMEYAALETHLLWDSVGCRAPLVRPCETRSEVRIIGPMARPRVTIATMATETPMGAQLYQEQVARRASTGLQSVDDREWTVRRLVVRSLRSKLPGDRQNSGRPRLVGVPSGTPGARTIALRPRRGDASDEPRAPARPRGRRDHHPRCRRVALPRRVAAGARGDRGSAASGGGDLRLGVQRARGRGAAGDHGAACGAQRRRGSVLRRRPTAQRHPSIVRDPRRVRAARRRGIPSEEPRGTGRGLAAGASRTPRPQSRARRPAASTPQ